MYELSESQEQAIHNMEAYIGVRNHRKRFESRDDFQTYWDNLQRRCEQVKQQRQREENMTPAQRQRQRARKQERQLNYYRKPDQLLAWGRRYRQRYWPSIEQLYHKLYEKCDDADIARTACDIIADTINEADQIAEHIQRMLGHGKNRRYIEQKLRLRRYPAELIRHQLDQIAEEEEHGSLLDPDAVERKLTALQRQGLSKQAARSKLVECPADAVVVDPLLAEIYSDEHEQSNLERALDGLRRMELSDDKLIRRLMAKGYRYPEIKSALAARASDDS